MVRKKQGIFYGHILVAIFFLILVLAAGSNISFGVFLEPMLNEYGWSRSSISAAFSISTLISGVIGVLAGRLTDKIGPRLVLSVSAVCLGAGYALMAIVHSPWQMYLIYGLLTGIGNTGPMISLFPTLIRWYEKRRPLVISIVISGSSIGTIAISQIANWLITRFDWRIAFIVLGISITFIVGLVAQFIKRDPRSISQLPYGHLEKDDGKITNSPASGYSLTQALHTGQFWLLFGVICSIYFMAYTIIAHIVIHATGLSISRNDAVGLLTIISIAGLISRPMTATLTDKIGNRQMITIGLALISIAFIWLLFSRELWMLVIFAGIFGFAWSTILVPLSPFTAELFGLKSIGTITGINNIASNLGAALGPFLAGYIFDIQKNYQFAFILILIASLAALFMIFFIKRPAHNSSPGKGSTSR